MALTALIGISVPLAATLLLLGVILYVTHVSPLYHSSLATNISMALWGDVAPRALPGLMMVTMITIFGAVRFGAVALAESLSIRIPVRRPAWIAIAGLIAAIVWASLQQGVPSFFRALEVCARCLAVTAAVITADHIAGKRDVEQKRKIDPAGTFALLAGLATPFYLPDWTAGAVTDSYSGVWSPQWLLPSYAAGFLFCLTARAVQRSMAVTPPTPTPDR